MGFLDVVRRTGLGIIRSSELVGVRLRFVGIDGHRVRDRDFTGRRVVVGLDLTVPHELGGVTLREPPGLMPTVRVGVPAFEITHGVTLFRMRPRATTASRVDRSPISRHQAALGPQATENDSDRLKRKLWPLRARESPAQDGFDKYFWEMRPQPTITALPRIDLRHHREYLDPGEHIVGWKVDGGWAGAVRLTTMSDAIDIIGILPPMTGVSGTATIEWLPLTFGQRPWLRCPNCARRIAAVLIRGWDLVCASCCELPYATTRMTESERVLNKRHRLAALVGTTVVGARPTKPRWQRWPTFNRNLERYVDAELQFLGIGAVAEPVFSGRRTS